MLMQEKLAITLCLLVVAIPDFNVFGSMWGSDQSLLKAATLLSFGEGAHHCCSCWVVGGLSGGKRSTQKLLRAHGVFLKDSLVFCGKGCVLGLAATGEHSVTERGHRCYRWVTRLVYVLVAAVSLEVVGCGCWGLVGGVIRLGLVLLLLVEKVEDLIEILLRFGFLVTEKIILLLWFYGGSLID